MRCQLLVVGRAADAEIQSLIDQYQSRMARYCSVSWKLLPPSRHQQEMMVRRDESDRIRSELPKNANVILLDERGRQLTNTELAQRFDSWFGSQAEAVFVVGGAYGVDDDLRRQAQFTWSLSSLVFPHHIAWLLVIEQLYRTCMIRSGHPYHHE